MISDAEAVDIKATLIVLSNAQAASAKAQTLNAVAMTSLSKDISGMLLGMKERDVRDEYAKQEIEETKETLKKALDFTMPIVRRAKAQQDRQDRIRAGFDSWWVKMIAAGVSSAVIVGALALTAQALGIDVSNVFVK